MLRHGQVMGCPGGKTKIMRAECKPVYSGGRVYLVCVLLLFVPVSAMAGGTQLSFEWDPNPEPDIAGYRLFSREPGEDYDYDNPAWEGQENVCSVFIDDSEGMYLFVVRAFNEIGVESDDSNEVVYSDDRRSLDGFSSSEAGGCFIISL